MIKRFLVLLFLLATCCAPASHSKPPAPPAALEVLLNETVALTTQSDFVFCGGTWISNNEVLTAFHCVRDLAPDPTGYYVRLRLRTGGYKGSKVHVTLPDLDLAKLWVDDPGPHTFARMTDHVIGESVWTIGHPVNLGNWTHFYGQIAQDTFVFSPNTHLIIPVIRTSSPAYPGNSGGGLFNMSGNLVGVCSMHAWDEKSSGYFIPLTRDITVLL